MSLPIRVKDLFFSYGAAPVLERIGLHVDGGDFAGIIGPNGSGKSTLLKTLAALLKPACGEIILDERELKQWSRRELSRALAVVNQGERAGFNFFVEEVVAMGRYPYLDRFSAMCESDRRAVERAMHLTGCYHLRSRDIFALSGGERQRVIMARALAQETPCLLLDEPTSFLDLGYQIEILELLQSLNRREKLTVIVVMHELNLASRYCRRLFLLHQGRIFACGTPGEVLTRENILEVYRTEVLVEPHPLGGNPLVTPIFTADRLGRTAYRAPVHVIGGGGSATPVIKELYARGIPLSAGVLSVGDSDWATARRLGLTLIEEAPFAPIGEERHRENLALIDRAGAVVLAPLYLGPGNLNNVKAACHALERGLPVMVINDPAVEARDFAGGAGKGFYERLEKMGALFVPRPDTDRLAAFLDAEPRKDNLPDR